MKKIILIVVFVLLICIACYSKISVPHYSLKSAKIKGTKINLVLLTDLHSAIYGKNQQKLLEHVKEQNPDLVLLVGDIADDKVSIRGMSLLLEGIQGLCPIYYTTGNHEYWSGDIQSIRTEIEKYGVKILSDEYVEIQVKGTPLIIAGLEDPDKQSYETPNYSQLDAMETAFGGLDELEGYKILLAHRPERIEQYLEYPFDLVVSGHAHGGQVRIPYLLNGLYAPNQGVFPRYAGGLYPHGEATHIVSRGLAKNWIPRVFNRPEVVSITLEV